MAYMPKEMSVKVNVEFVSALTRAFDAAMVQEGVSPQARERVVNRVLFGTPLGYRDMHFIDPDLKMDNTNWLGPKDWTPGTPEEEAAMERQFGLPKGRHE